MENSVRSFMEECDGLRVGRCLIRDGVLGSEGASSTRDCK